MFAFLKLTFRPLKGETRSSLYPFIYVSQCKNKEIMKCPIVNNNIMFVHNVYLSLSVTSAPSSNTILFTGRLSSDALVFNFTERTSPLLWLVYTSKIRPSGQEFRGVLSSRTNTMSPTTKFLCSLFHFWHCCNDERYSLIQRRQNTSAKY